MNTETRTTASFKNHFLMDEVMRRDEKMQRHFEEEMIKERVNKNGCIPELQKSLNALANIADKCEGKENGNYFSVLSMIYTLIEEGKLNDLHNKLVVCFPEYYTMQKEDEGAIIETMKELKEGIESGKVFNQLFK